VSVRQCCLAFLGRAPDRRARPHSRARGLVLPAADYVLARANPPTGDAVMRDLRSQPNSKADADRGFNRNSTILLKIYIEVISAK